MSTLCIQIHPNRVPDMDMARVRALGEGIASNKALVKRFSVVEGEDNGPYSNFMFETAELQNLWRLLQDVLYKDEKVGSALCQASMAMCEGKDGWNDYLLLYHFDQSVKLDNLNAQNLPIAKEEDSLTKVHIDLPNHWATGGEFMWALPLGDDLYEIRNSPFYAYGVNWGDVVRADSDDPSLKPEVRQVVKRSGNKTLRVFFKGELSEEEQDSVLSSLQYLDLSWERATERLVAIDVHPKADYQAVCHEFWELEQKEMLEYETCEARVPASFDDEPPDDE